MATVYARQTVLHNVGGRLDYIGSSKRQESLLAYFDGASQQLQGSYWETVAEESQLVFSQHGEPAKKAVEGRELVVKLPNSLLGTMEPEQVCQIMAASFEHTYHRPAAVALHYNKTKSNLHAHLVYSERELLPEPVVKVAPRNLFFDEQGKRRYKRREILNEAGDLRSGCRIVPKGEVYEQRFFGTADPQFHFKSWLEAAKGDWLLPLLNGPLRGDVEYQLFDHQSGKLPQQHVGKNLPPEQKAAVEQYNELVKEYNEWVKTGEISPGEAQRIKGHITASGRKAETLEDEMTRIYIEQHSEEWEEWAEEGLEAPARPLNREPQERNCQEEEKAPTEPLRPYQPEERQSIRELLRQFQQEQEEAEQEEWEREEPEEEWDMEL